MGSAGRVRQKGTWKAPPCQNRLANGESNPHNHRSGVPPLTLQGGWEGKGGEGAEINMRTLSENGYGQVNKLIQGPQEDNEGTRGQYHQWYLSKNKRKP